MSKLIMLKGLVLIDQVPKDKSNIVLPENVKPEAGMFDNIVVAVGEGVDSVQVGDKVLIPPVLVHQIVQVDLDNSGKCRAYAVYKADTIYGKFQA
jgi:hypothetical protein